MTFTITDFPDLLRLLRENPEWQEELRAVVLARDLLELPALVRQLAEAQGRTEHRLDTLTQRVEALAEAQIRTEQRLDTLTQRVEALAEAQVRTEQRLTELADAQARATYQLTVLAEAQGRTEQRMGSVMGTLLEWRYERRAAAYCAPFARRIRPIDFSTLADLLDEAVGDGRMSERERSDVMATDIVLSGRRHENQDDLYLLVEVSVGIGRHDVDRAAERAAILAKLGRPVVAVVAGERLDVAVADYATTKNVRHIVDGRTRSAAPQEP